MDGMAFHAPANPGFFRGVLVALPVSAGLWAAAGIVFRMVFY
jgi:hypothetical protein